MTVPLRTEFNDFLFAPVADDGNGMPLTMLSALARTGVDPWAEAAGLADLSRESATQKLIAVLAGVPNGPSPGADTATAATRLVALLHSSPKSPSLPAGSALPATAVTAQSRRVRLAIYSLLALAIMLLANWAQTNLVAPTPAGTSEQSSP